MSRHHTQRIRALFHDPPVHCLYWRDVEALLERIRVSVESISGARLRATVGRVEDVLHRTHGGAANRQTLPTVRALLG